ncbi:hypothetical protein D3C76_1365910 [compost metagenome]
MVGEAERQLEGALGDALVQVGDVVGRLLAPTTTDGQHATFDLQFQILLPQAGDGDDDAIVIVTMLLDVVGRIGAAGLVAQGRLEEIVETVETNGLTEQRGERKSVAHGESPE